MKIPFKYTLRNFGNRKLTTGITLAGIALVVFVFAAVLMMAYGIQKTMKDTGNSDNVMVFRKSATSEITSIIGPDVQNIVSTLPHIAKTADGTPIISYEPVVIINLESVEGNLSNITVKELRPQMKIIRGRMFRWGMRELIAGEAITKRFKGAQIGSYVKFAGDNWKIVGVFSTDGSGFDSEMWGDALQLLNAFNRGTTVSTVTLKLDSPENFDSFKNAFEADKRLEQFKPEIEKQYFEDQSQLMSNFIKILGLFITIIFSFGAIIGAMITMYASVANRTVEIGTLRSLGFSRRSILSAFLAESLFISLAGGAIGLFLASFLQLFTVSTLNFGSFAELTFSFALSPSIITGSFIFAGFMGILGGFLPSVRAARLNIVNALRAG